MMGTTVGIGNEADGVLKGLRVERMPTYDEINNFPGGGQYRGVDERNEWRGEKGMIV